MKQSELGELQQKLSAKVAENENNAHRLKEQRKKDIAAANSEPAIQRAITDIASLERQVDEARRKQKASELNT